MCLLTKSRDSVFRSCLLFSLFTIINCQVFNSKNGNVAMGEVNRIMEMLHGQQYTDVFETINLITQRNITNGMGLIADIECDNQIQRYRDGIIKMEMWALKMLDATSKIPSGILQGNLMDIGMYDECVSVRVVEENMTIIGRHCMYELSGIIPASSFPIVPTLSVCLPAACGRDDIHNLLQSFIDMTTRYLNGTKINVTSVTCSNVDPQPLDTGVIITIVFFGILICFLMICTIFDCTISQTDSIKTNNSLLHALCKFSLYTNGKRILSTTVPQDSLPAITGLRFFSMCWVIFGHSYIQLFSGAVINKAYVMQWLPSWNSVGVLIAPFAVDTFFVMSGFLTSYIFLREMEKRRRFNPILFYIHRYVRLTPALIALLLLTIFVLPRLGSGALWQTNMELQKHYCSEYWWNLLLYIQNYRKIEVMACLGHTWYLAVDMQLYWISPIILYPLYKRPRVGLFILALFIVASIVTPTVIALEKKISAGLFNIRNMETLVDVMGNFYIRTYNRAIPWLMGVFVGYKLVTGKTSHGTYFVRFGWLLTILSFCFIIFTYRIFQNPNYMYNVYWEGFYAAFSRVIWGFGVCWIIYSSALGYGGFVSDMLSSTILLPFSRISYSVYLVHLLIQNMKMNAVRSPQYFSNTEMISRFFSDLMLATVVGFIFSLLFESPFLVLEKLLTGTEKKQSTESQENMQVDERGGIDNHAFESDIHQDA